MATKFKLDTLKQVHSLLKSNIDSGRKIKYRIPSLWVNLKSKKLIDYEVNPFLYYKNKIEEILEYNSPVKNGKDDLSGNWSRRAVTYNIFVRLTTAYDHNGNNQIDLQQSPSSGGRAARGCSQGDHPGRYRCRRQPYQGGGHRTV